MSATVRQDPDAGDDRGAVVPAEGSTLYYSLLWTPPAARMRFLETLALTRTLSTTLDDVTDRGVAERKVHWWHEELARLAAGEPRHPRTVACVETFGGGEPAMTALLDVLSVAATTRFTPPPDTTEWQERLVRDYGARLALLARSLGGNEAATTGPDVRHARLAVGLALQDTLARLPALLHRGYAVFPDASYKAQDCDPATLARRVRREVSAEGTLAGIPVVEEGAPPVAASEGGGPDRLIGDIIDTASLALDEALADARYHATYSTPSLAPLARLAALRSRQLHLWQARTPDLLRERLTLTPLGKFLVAWRHRRGPRPPRDTRPRVH